MFKFTYDELRQTTIVDRIEDDNEMFRFRQGFNFYLIDRNVFLSFTRSLAFLLLAFSAIDFVAILLKFIYFKLEKVEFL